MPARSDSRSRSWFTVAVHLAPVVVSGLFLWLVADIVIRGGAGFASGAADAGQSLLSALWEFFTDEPRRFGRSGGIGPILVSTGLILGVSIAVSAPLSFGTAIALSEFTDERSLFGRWVRRSLDLLAGVPSIVFGLFGNVLFCQVLGLKFSILSGGLTLACMVLPLWIRTTEEGLRAVPLGQRQAAAALGLSRVRQIARIILPQAAPAIVVGLVLSIGRALAETAVLLFTSGYVMRMPGSLLDSGRSLSVHIYDLATNVTGGDPRAYASATLLIVLLVSINIIAQSLVRRSLQREIVHA